MAAAMKSKKRDKEIEKIKSAIEGVDFSDTVEKIKQHLEETEDLLLNIAITGETGSGKSSFINSIRGLKPRDEGAAKVGCVETTMEPAPYSHPTYNNVIWWDLPGIGTPNFRADHYLHKVHFFKYDFFIIVVSGRFRENDVKLARAIQDMGKKFYIVRSKFDIDIDSMRRQEEDVEEEALKKTIRDECMNHLKKAGIEAPQIFFVDTAKNNMFDFPILQETILKELPSHKRHALLLSLPNISGPVLERKRDALKAGIRKAAMVSSGSAMVPIPGAGFALVKAMKGYQKVFGLDNDSLSRLSRTSGKSIETLKSVTESPLVVGDVTKDIVLNHLRTLAFPPFRTKPFFAL